MCGQTNPLTIITNHGLPAELERCAWRQKGRRGSAQTSRAGNPNPSDSLPFLCGRLNLSRHCHRDSSSPHAWRFDPSGLGFYTWLRFDLVMQQMPSCFQMALGFQPVFQGTPGGAAILLPVQISEVGDLSIFDRGHFLITVMNELFRAFAPV